MTADCISRSMIGNPCRCCERRGEPAPADPCGLLQRLVEFIRGDQCDEPCWCCYDYLRTADHLAQLAGLPSNPRPPVEPTEPRAAPPAEALAALTELAAIAESHVRQHVAEVENSCMRVGDVTSLATRVRKALEPSRHHPSTLPRYLFNFLATRNGGALLHAFTAEDRDLLIEELGIILKHGGHPPNWVPQPSSDDAALAALEFGKSSDAINALPHMLAESAPGVDKALEAYYRAAFVRLTTVLDDLAGEMLDVARFDERRRGEAEIQRLKNALGEIAALGDVCEECEVSGAPMATHSTHHSVTGIPITLCAEHAEEARAAHRKAESKGCGKQPDVEEHEQETAVTLALAALKGGTTCL